MILTCKECQTRYLVKPAAITVQGKTVKCAMCGHSWFQKPEGDIPSGTGQDTRKLPPITPKRASLPVVQPKPKTPALLRYTALISLIFVTGSVPFLYYQPLQKRFPAIQAFYPMVGIPTTEGLGFEELVLRRGTGESYVLRGKMVNASTQPRTMPNLRINVMDEKDRVRRTILLKSSGEKLAAGESFNFNNNIEALPQGAYYLTLDIGNKLELMFR